MIKVKYFKSNWGYEHFEMTGHSELNPGNDIICAGASALGWALIGTLENMTSIEKDTTISPGQLKVKVTPLLDQDKQELVNAVFDTVLIGLMQIQKKYPENIKIICQG